MIRFPALYSLLSLSLSLCIPLILLQMYMEDKRHSAAGTSVTLDQHMLMWLARRLLEGILLHAKLEYGGAHSWIFFVSTRRACASQASSAGADGLGRSCEEESTPTLTPLL